MKTRTVGTIEEAIFHAKHLLGAKVCAEALGRSESMIYKMSDHDHASQMTMAQALELHRLCLQHSGQSPFLALLMHDVQRLAPQVTPEHIKDKAIDATHAVAQLSVAISKAMTPESDHGARLSAAERAEIQKHRGDVMHELSALDVMLQPQPITEY